MESIFFTTSSKALAPWPIKQHHLDALILETSMKVSDYCNKNMQELIRQRVQDHREDNYLWKRHIYLNQ